MTADEAGSVEDVRRVCGHPRLAEAAKDAVRQWKYEPTYLGGQPVSVVFTVRVMMSPE